MARSLQLLTVTEEQALFDEYRCARNHGSADRRDEPVALIESRIFVAFKPLVLSMAHRFAAMNDRTKIEDLVSAGSEALLIAMRRFDPQRGYRFGTYARFWLTNKMLGQVRFDKWVTGIPDDVFKEIVRMSKSKSGWDGKTVYRPRHRIFADDLIPWCVADTLSLDTPVGADGESTIGDFLEDNRNSEESDFVNVEGVRLVHRLLDKLPYEQKLILKLRFLDGLTLYEAARKTNRSIKSVAKLQAKARRNMMNLCHEYGIVNPRLRAHKVGQRSYRARKRIKIDY